MQFTSGADHMSKSVADDTDAVQIAIIVDILLIYIWCRFHTVDIKFGEHLCTVSAGFPVCFYSMQPRPRNHPMLSMIENQLA